ncbi:winged helix-turn-helix transcriptional regulator [Candidatus Pacearchaeota archaeon]|nr:winged helix-turn-helix transcriptional regulator [Candidatus Pacearchaeota archaeon]
MDKIDNKILVELVKNSRIPYTQLAKRCRVSREVLNYRIKNLKKKEIIHDFFTEIDAVKLGYVSALFFVRIKASREKEFIEYIKKSDFISWAGTHCGLWSLGMAIYGKNNTEIEERFQEIYIKFKEWIVDHRFEFYKTTKFYYEKYFNSTPIKKHEKYKDYKIDPKDKFILKKLSKNSRITSIELSKKINISAPAIIKRIKNLEKSGYILKYSIFVNLSKLNKYQFVFFIQNKNLENRSKLYLYLESHPKVSFLLDYLGDPFIEFGIFVDNPYEVRGIEQEIEETFPENRIIDFFLVQEDFISTGVPPCIFD